MKCEQQPGNVDCKNCTIKKLIKADSIGQIYVAKKDLSSAGLSTEKHPKNGWLSLPKKETVTCARNIEYNVKE